MFKIAIFIFDNSLIDIAIESLHLQKNRLWY